MGYTKKWIPPTIPLRDDLTAWKALFQDVHDNLLLSGLVQTATPGQLVIADVSALPADGTYAGFIEYAFDDALQATAPIVIKLEYGCGAEGLNPSGGDSQRRSRTPRIRVTVTCNGKLSSTFACPQSLNLSSLGTSQLTTFGTSYLVYNPAQGFFGCVYGAGSRNKPFASSYGSYYGATLTLFVQRSTDAAGQPTAAGMSLYAPGLVGQGVDGLWDSGVLDPALGQYIDAATGSLSARNDLAVRLGGNSNSVINGEIQTQQIFAATPHLKPWPTIVSYNVDDVLPGTEFMLEVFPGSPQNFIALGNETSISIDGLIGQRGAVAMLFE